MSLLSWFSPKKPTKATAPESSGLSRMEATRPVVSNKNSSAKTQASGSEHAGNRKTERMARRELLYSVVRESMVRAGVLSQSYKFKVLSLDQRGRQFLVMMDLASEFGGETHRLAEIEVMIAQNAKSRYDILVTAVYWRMNEHVAVGVPSAARVSGPIPLESQPVPLSAPSHHTPAVPRYEPIQADEVAAFKRALAAGIPAAASVASAAAAKGKPAAAAAADPGRGHGPRSYTLLTGYEDTEMPDPDVRAPALSATQYGDLN